MAQAFIRDQKLKYVTWADACYETGKNHCTSIIVIIENGQMTGVPWAVVEFDDKCAVKVNLALMEEVGLAEDPSCKPL